MTRGELQGHTMGYSFLGVIGRAMALPWKRRIGSRRERGAGNGIALEWKNREQEGERGGQSYCPEMEESKGGWAFSKGYEKVNERCKRLKDK